MIYLFSDLEYENWLLIESDANVVEFVPYLGIRLTNILPSISSEIHSRKFVFFGGEELKNTLRLSVKSIGFSLNP